MKSSLFRVPKVLHTSCRWLLAIGLLWLVVSCQPNAPLESPEPDPSDDLSIAEAKAWFEAHISSSNPNARTSGGMGAFMSRTPLWQLATQVKTKNSKTGWLVPLNFNQLRRYTFRNGLQSSNRTQNMLMTYLLQYKENGKINLKVLEYMPEDSYLTKNKGLVYAKDFSGKVFVKSWEGKTIGGGEYQNGKRLTTFSPKSANGRTSATVCDQVATAYFTNGCVLGQEVIIFGHQETVEGCNNGFLINTHSFPAPYGTCAGWSLTDVDCINVCREVPDPIYDPNPIFFPPAGGGFGSQPITNSDIRLINLSDNPCANSVFLSLTSQTGDMAGFINSFASPGGRYTQFTYNIEISNNVSGTAITNSDGIGVLSTKLNCQYLKEATKLSIARTFLHEALHAYMYAYLIKEGKSAFVHNFPDVIWQFGGANLNTHDQMANRYLNIIAEALRDFDNNRQNDAQFYRDIAWGGLTGTPAFLALSEADKSRIRIRLADEQVGNNDSKGEKCSNTGGGCN